MNSNVMETKSIQVPTSWDEVKLCQFDKLVEISNDKELSVTDREIKLIAVLTGLSYGEVSSLDAISFQKISNSLGFLNEAPEKKMPMSEFELNGKKYHADLYPGRFTAAQFLDYKVIAGEDIDRKTARLIACFVYPIDSKYNDGSYDVEELVDEIYQHMPVTEVTGLAGFFMLQYRAYSVSLLEYSIRKTKKLKGMSEQDRKKMLENLKNARDLIKNSGMFA